MCVCLLSMSIYKEHSPLKKAKYLQLNVNYLYLHTNAKYWQLNVNLELNVIDF